jgi:hypothetical protein
MGLGVCLGLCSVMSLMTHACRFIGSVHNIGMFCHVTYDSPCCLGTGGWGLHGTWVHSGVMFCHVTYDSHSHAVWILGAGVLCDATKKKLYFSADRSKWIFMMKDNEVVFNEDFYLLCSTKYVTYILLESSCAMTMNDCI